MSLIHPYNQAHLWLVSAGPGDPDLLTLKAVKALQQAEKDAKVAEDIAEARDKPNPNEGFADEAHNKIDQDLMMLENGIRTRDL